MTPQRKRKAQARELTIRMYNVGFGDCFMLFIPTSGGERRILVDCGTRKLGGVPMAEIVSRVVADAKDAGTGRARIDVVVASHRHADHISGFADKAWADVDVGEVWMPWTENPSDTKATKIRDAQTRLAAALAASLEKRPANSGNGALGIRTALDLAQLALTSENATKTLLHGFAGDPVRRFLPGKEKGSSALKTNVLPGVVVQVLGPSRDPAVIAQMDPPAGQSYLSLASSRTEQAESDSGLFRDVWKVSPADYAANWSDLAGELSPKDRTMVKEVGSGDDEDLAAALDNAVNGTSLMLALQIGSATLLLPGDAQWGTWNCALQNEGARSVLKDTTFYKVSHHGSENATPVEFVEQLMAKDIWAMVSVTKLFTRVPKPALLDALKTKTDRIARSDRPKEGPAKYFKVLDKSTIETRIPF